MKVLTRVAESPQLGHFFTGLDHRGRPKALYGTVVFMRHS